MSSSRFLDYEVALLLAKYGKTALIGALARKLQLAPDELERILETHLHEAPGSQAKKRPSRVDLVAQLAEAYPNKAQLLRTLNGRFASRMFLPELRDVKRFFEQHDRPLGAARSRIESLPKILRLLAELDTAELEALCQAQPEGGYSSLGVISDEILRRNK